MAWPEQTGIHSWRVRYRRGVGTESISGFSSEEAARSYISDMDTDRRRGTWIDPAGSNTTLTHWGQRWFSSLDLDPRTLEHYRSYLRCHLLPRFGSVALGAITALDITTWVKDNVDAGYSPETVAGWVKLLSMVLTDAVDERLIASNPVRQRRRRGRRSRRIIPEKVWATPEQVLRIANQAAALGGRIAWLLIITAGWTGCRWGELAGLHRDNLDLDTGYLTVHPEHGALHESNGTRWLGPPKTAASARTIALPPFLTALLRRHLATHPFEFVFTTPSGTWLWRSTFIRRVLRPAIDGNLTGPKPGIRAYPIRPGLTFHGLRHSQKTWLIAGGAPEIAQARRLGHHLRDRVVETYSHVAREVETRLLADLQRRWTKANRHSYLTPRRAKPHSKWPAPTTAGEGVTAEKPPQQHQKGTAQQRSSCATLLQKRSSRGTQNPRETITKDRKRNTKNPSDQPKRLDRRGSLRCGAKGTRTPDPLTASEVRYQLRHSPGTKLYSASRGYIRYTVCVSRSRGGHPSLP